MPDRLTTTSRSADEPDAPRVAVLIPTYDNRETLESVLRAAASHDLPLVVIDDASTDGCDAIIADRLRAATFLPVLQSLDEDVASPADIDMGAGLALRFGKAPCELMDTLGKDEVTRIVSIVTEKYGHDLPASLAKVGSLRG